MGALATPRPDTLGVSQQVYSPADFRAIQQMIHGMAGIALPDHKATLVYSRLVPRLRVCGAATFSAYLDRLRADADERYAALCALTTNHTLFFRESHHFDHLRDVMRPQWVERLARGGSVRVWSSACSTGEEPWTVMLTLLGESAAGARELGRGSFRMLATDIDRNVLKTASAARYPIASLDGIPPPLASAWTVRDGAHFTLAEAARALVRFRPLNLVGPWPMTGGFDAIFCRNVMIYFDTDTKARLVARLVDQLRPGGILYIGHSERITTSGLPGVREEGPTIYRKEGTRA